MNPGNYDNPDIPEKIPPFYPTEFDFGKYNIKPSGIRFFEDRYPNLRTPDIRQPTKQKISRDEVIYDEVNPSNNSSSYEKDYGDFFKRKINELRNKRQDIDKHGNETFSLIRPEDTYSKNTNDGEELPREFPIESSLNTEPEPEPEPEPKLQGNFAFAKELLQENNPVESQTDSLKNSHNKTLGSTFFTGKPSLFKNPSSRKPIGGRSKKHKIRKTKKGKRKARHQSKKHIRQSKKKIYKTSIEIP